MSQKVKDVDLKQIPKVFHILQKVTFRFSYRSTHRRGREFRSSLDKEDHIFVVLTDHKNYVLYWFEEYIRALCSLVFWERFVNP